MEVNFTQVFINGCSQQLNSSRNRCPTNSFPQTSTGDWDCLPQEHMGPCIPTIPVIYSSFYLSSYLYVPFWIKLDGFIFILPRWHFHLILVSGNLLSLSANCLLFVLVISCNTGAQRSIAHCVNYSFFLFVSEHSQFLDHYEGWEEDFSWLSAHYLLFFLTLMLYVLLLFFYYPD